MGDRGARSGLRKCFAVQPGIPAPVRRTAALGDRALTRSRRVGVTQSLDLTKLNVDWQQLFCTMLWTTGDRPRQTMNSVTRYGTLFVLTMLLAVSRTVTAAAIY